MRRLRHTIVYFPLLISFTLVSKANDVPHPDSLWCAPRVDVPTSEFQSSRISDWESSRELVFFENRIVRDTDGLFSYWDIWDGSPYNPDVLNLYDAAWEPQARLSIYEFTDHTSYINNNLYCTEEFVSFSDRTELEQLISRPDAMARCTLSATIRDNTGYGWENGQTCIVSSETNCEDRGGFPWGWDPVNLNSCRLDERQCVDSDGDGWGWDGFQSCLLPQVPRDECTYVDAEFNDGWGWNPVTVESCPPEN